MLGEYVLSRKREFGSIPEERKKTLARLARSIAQDVELECSSDLIFICTHNSRRSHMAQIWAQFSSVHYQIDGVRCYSGGTEATAFNSSAVDALSNAGFSMEQMDDSENPEYQVYFPGEEEGISVFSKKYEDPPNPTKGFLAVMTCSDADEACPVVEGAKSRFAITYEDPKAFDGSPEEKAGYEERCRQIAREMLYLFSLV